MKSKQFCIATILVVLGLVFAASIQAQDDPPTPVKDDAASILTAEQLAEASVVREALQKHAIKMGIRLKVMKEKKKRRFQRDQKKIADLELILKSDEFLDYAHEQVREAFESVEAKHFEARGPPTASDLGDGSLMEKLIEYLFEGDGFERILKFIIGLIDAFATNNSTIQQHYPNSPSPSLGWTVMPYRREV